MRYSTVVSIAVFVRASARAQSRVGRGRLAVGAGYADQVELVRRFPVDHRRRLGERFAGVRNL